MKTYNLSSVGIVQRINKTPENPFGTITVNFIPVSKPALVIFGGSGTKIEKNANNYATRLENLLKENKIENVNIYSIFYKFNSRDSYFDEVNLFRKAGRKIALSTRDEFDLKNMNKNEPEPDFIKKLYKDLIKPRVTNKNNEKLEINLVLKNIGKLKIFLHCYGASVMRFLEEFMSKEMITIGYKNKEIKEIQKNLLVIAHAPSAPLEKSAFTVLSFVSAEDNVLNHHNLFNKYISHNSIDLSPSFFPEPRGNIFIVRKSKIGNENEHFTSGITNFEDSILTDDGKVIFAAERNAIVNGVKHSIQGGLLPSIRNLVSGNGVNFDTMLKNGESFYNEMVSDLRFMKQTPKHVNQK